jgi:hypothetical protein
MFSGLSNFIFGDPSEPYKKAGEQYEKYSDKSAGYQKPFYYAGKGAIPKYQNWLKSMSDPSQFINNLTNQYQTSPQEQYAQQQAMRAGQNMGSATGMTGSTPLLMQEQENSGNIANQYQQEWLKNVLGINTEYGGGLSHLMGVGQGSGNQLSNIYNMLGKNMAEMEYGQSHAEQQQMNDLLGLLLGGGAGYLNYRNSNRII